MAQNKIISLLSLAAKAGRITSGEFAAERAIKDGKARLIIVAEDASDNTKKKFTNSCSFYRVPILILFNKEILGHGIGKEMRASLAVLDTGFADAIVKQMNQLNENQEKAAQPALYKEKVGD